MNVRIPEAAVVTLREALWVRVAWLLAGVLWSLNLVFWAFHAAPALEEWVAENVFQRPRIQAMAVSQDLFRIGEHLCKVNGGLRRIEIELPVQDAYTFVCSNNARFVDTVAKVK